MPSKVVQYAERHKKRMGAALEYLWKNPETGYQEWKAHEYLAKEFSGLGYTLTPAGNIPGFTAEVDTGLPGPTLAIFGELDGLICPEHPDADPRTGAVHACGHCAQAATLLGIAAALKEPGALEGMCGRIRLVAVPAEELIQTSWRQQLREAGTIRYFGGKPEFLYRGLLDGVDMSFMIHTMRGSADAGFLNRGTNGCMTKLVLFRGKAAHAGGAPHLGNNALYAANQAMSAINALRETFRDQDHIRVHPILTEAGSSVNAIPDRVAMECYIRSADARSMQEANLKVNRAIAASAAALGCRVTIDDRHGYFPRLYDRQLLEVAKQAMEQVLEKTVYEPQGWGAGCSDMGDMTMLMPGVHPFVGGAEGAVHSSEFRFTQPEEACLNSAKVQLLMLWQLLRDEAALAKQILADFQPVFSCKEEYLRHVDAMTACWEAVLYRENGSVIILPEADTDSKA